MTNLYNKINFEAVLGQNQEVQPKEYKTVRDLTFVGYVSEGLAKFAFDLYTRHGLNHANLDGMNYIEVKSEVERLNALPFPPSIKQKETILSLIDEIKALNNQFDVPSNVLKSLTGGQDGTAGKFIEFLYNQRNEYARTAPLTDKQAEQIVKWIFCPDILWEEYNISLKMAYPTELNPNGWKFVTTEELTAQLKENMTQDQAWEFIGRYQNVFYDWKRTRITERQVQKIRTLEERMLRVGKVGVKTFATNEKGEVIEVYKKVNREWSSQSGYEPMNMEHLQQLSIEDANKYIGQLESEVSYRERSAIDNSTQQETFEQKRNSMKKAVDEADAHTKEYRALVDLAFALEAVAGQENDELHESITELMVKRNGSPITVAKELHDFMMFLVEGKFITVQGLVQLTEASSIASQIVQLQFPEAYDQAINGRKSQDQVQKEQIQKQVEKNKTADDTVQDFMNQFM